MSDLSIFIFGMLVFGVAIGSSLVVYPAAAFPGVAQRSGAKLVILNRDPTDQDAMADLVLNLEIGPTLSAALSK